MRCILTALGVGFAALAASADPRIEVLPHGAIDLSSDGCIAMGPSGVRQENGIATALMPEFANQPQETFAVAMTPDASVALGGHHDIGTWLFRVGDGPQLPTSGHSFRALSHDGRSVVGRQYGSPDLPFHWRDGSLQPLPNLPVAAPGGSAEAVSADGGVVAGWSLEETGRFEAVVWSSPSGPPQRLGFLPGHQESEITALSADGLVAIGLSRSASDARAFRWDGTALADLGPQTDIAHAVSADGGLVVGSGPDGAFIWDAAHGTRLLADALQTEHGVDVGGWILESATQVAANGRAFAGTGRDPGGAPRTWLVRLDDAPCPPGPPIDLVRHQGASAPLEMPNGLVIDSARRVSVAGYLSRNVVRFDAAFGQFPPSPAVELLDLKDDGPPGETTDVPLVLGVAPDDSLYVSAYARNQLLRIAPDGSQSLLFDGSAYPLLDTATFGPTPTAPFDLAVAPDGTLFVAALARLLRIDPDGSVHELLDALEAAQSAGYYSSSPFFGVALQPGRVLVQGDAAVFAVARDSGVVLEAYDLSDPAPLRSFAPDGEGGVWIGGQGLAYLSPDGAMHRVFSWEDGEDVTGFPPNAYLRGFVAGDDGSVFYTDGDVVIHRQADGTPIRLLDASTPDVFMAPLTGFGSLAFAQGVLYWTYDLPVHVGRLEIELPAPPACANGLDDDGDGAVDFPADRGCHSRADGWERSPRLGCDNGFDDDADGQADYPSDPGCAAHAAPDEAPECSDGIDNDGDGASDWDGAGVGAADPECAGDPRRVIEHPWSCGLGFEVALVALPLAQAARRRRRQARSAGDPGLAL